MFFEELMFWKKKKARRKFEKENGLPKSVIIHPNGSYLIILGILVVFVAPISYFLLNRNVKQNNTKIKISKIEGLLEAEKKAFKEYPIELSTIIRKNPFHKDLMVDDWNNDLIYKTFNNRLGYTLISKGRDNVINTEDDIKIEK